MSNAPKRKWGCLWIGAYLFLGITLLNMADGWWRKRPRQVLERFLDVKWSSKITKLETQFSDVMDSTLHIYLEADEATIQSILANGFVKDLDQSDLQRTSDLSFDGAPDAMLVPLLHYSKNEGSLMEHLGITLDGKRLWYAAYDY